MDNVTETRRKGRGFPDAAKSQQVAKSGATCASIEDPPTSRTARGSADGDKSQLGRSGGASSSANATIVQKKERGVTEVARNQGAKSGAPFVVVEDPPTRRKGRGFAETKPAAKSGASSASVEDTPIKRKGRGFTNAAKSQATTSGAPSVAVKDPPTRRKGRGFLDVSKKHVGTSGATSASVEDTTVQQKGRGCAGPAQNQVVKTGAACYSAKDAAMQKKKGRGSAGAARTQAKQNGTDSASVGDTTVAKNGFADAARGQGGKKGAASVDNPAVTTRKGRKFMDAARSQMGHGGTAASSSAAEYATATKKGRSLLRATKGPVGERGAVSASLGATATAKQACGRLNTARGPVGHNEVGHGGNAKGSVPTGRKGSSNGDGGGVRRVGHSGTSVSASSVGDTTLAKKGPSSSNATQGPAGHSRVASSSAEGTAGGRRNRHSSSCETGSVSSSCRGSGHGNGGGIHKVEKNGTAAASSAGDANLTKKEPSLSNATRGPVGHDGVAPASAEGTAVHGRNGRSSAEGAVPSGRKNSGREVRQVGKSSADAASSVGDATLAKKWLGPLNARRGPVGRSVAASASAEGTVAWGRDGCSNAEGSAPGGRKGGGRGVGGGTLKPSSPKSNTIGGFITMARGKRHNGNGGRANRGAEGSSGSAPVKPVSLSGPRKGLAPIKSEGVSSSKLAKVKATKKSKCEEWGVPAKSESLEGWRGGAVEEKGQHKVSCGVKRNERLVEASTPEKNDAEFVAEEPTVPGDKVGDGQAATAQDGENGGGSTDEEADPPTPAALMPSAPLVSPVSPATPTALVAPAAPAAPAAPTASAVEATLEVPVPGDVGQVVSSDTANVAKVKEGVVETCIPKDQHADYLAGAAAAPSHKLATDQLDAVGDGEEEVEEDGREGVKGGEGAAPAVPRASATPAEVVTPEVSVPGGVSQAANVESPDLPEGKGPLVEASGSNENYAEAVAEELDVVGDKAPASQAATVQNGGGDGASGDEEEAAAAPAVPAAPKAPKAPKAPVSPAAPTALVSPAIPAAPAAPAVAATLEVAAPGDVGRVVNPDTPNVAKGKESVVETCAAKGQHADSLAGAAAAPSKKFVTGQPDDVGDGEKDGGEDGGEDVGGNNGRAVTVMTATQEGDIPTDVSAAECIEPLVETQDAEAQDADKLAGAAAAAATDCEFCFVEATQDGGEDRGQDRGRTVTAVTAVTATRGVDAPAGVGKEGSGESSSVSDGTEPLVEALASEAQDGVELIGAAAAAADELEGCFVEAVPKEDGRQDSRRAVTETGEVGALANVGKAANVERASVADGTEPSVGAQETEAQGADELAGAAFATVDDNDKGFVETVQDSGGGGSKASGRTMTVVTAVTTVATYGEVGVEADVGKGASVENTSAAEGTEPLVEALASGVQDTEDSVQKAAAAANDLEACAVEAHQNDVEHGREDGGKHSGRVAPAVMAVTTPPAAIAATLVRAARVYTFIFVYVYIAAILETGCGAQGLKRLVGASASDEKDADGVAEEEPDPADALEAGQADDVQDGMEDGEEKKENSEENGQEEEEAAAASVASVPEVEVAQDGAQDSVHALAEENVQATGGRNHGRGWWKRLVANAGYVLLPILLGVVGAWLCQGSEIPPTCGRKTALFEDGPLKPGECMESDGGSRWFGWVAGIGWKSRLHVSEDGGTYMGPDGTKVSLQNIDWEMNTGGGVFCSAERFVRKATRLGGPRYGVSPRDASPVPEKSIFCRPKATISTPSVLSLPPRGTAHFSEGDNLEIVNSWGKVLWSARDGLGLRRAGEKGDGKNSPDVSKGKHGRKGRKKDEREKVQTSDNKPGDVDGGARGWKWGRHDGGSDGHAASKPSGGQRRGIARVLGWV